MDLYCKRCGEPWELYFVEHEMELLEKSRFHAGTDGPSCKGMQPCHRYMACHDCPDRDPVLTETARCGIGLSKKLAKRPFRVQIAAALHDVLGDDLDGLAAEMEDAEYMLGAEFWE